jgi:hypothetical protein
MKTCLLLALVGLTVSFALPTSAEEQSAVDPETRQEIEAVSMQFVEALGNNVPPLWPRCTRRTRFAYWTG